MYRAASLGILVLAAVLAVSIPLLRQDIMADASGIPPWLAFTLGFKVFRVIELFPNWVLPAPVRTLDLAIAGFEKSQIIVALDTLGIADLLGDKGQTAQQLALHLGTPNSDKLARLLGAAAAFGMFSAHEASAEDDLVFHNNALSAVLRQDHPNTVTHTIKGFMQSLYGPWGLIAQGLQENKVPLELAHGKPFWDFIAEHPQWEHEFSLAMESQDKLGISAAVNDYNWTPYSRVIDVGAAYGSFLALLMQQQPALLGTVCDLPQVVERAKQQWQDKHQKLLNRTSFAACDFLTIGKLPSPNQAKEVYVLRDILHDWSDDKAVTILKSLRAAIGSSKTASVLLIEAALPGRVAGFEPSFRHLLDINMLVAVDGKERTVLQFANMFDQTGFVLKTVHATRGLYKVIEAGPV